VLHRSVNCKIDALSNVLVDTRSSLNVMAKKTYDQLSYQGTPLRQSEVVVKAFDGLKKLFWWSGLKCDVAQFVYSCLIYQKLKIEHQKLDGLMTPLDEPEWKWDSISMDFVTSLPNAPKGNDAIWVVVDRLTKSAHFIPIDITFPVS